MARLVQLRPAISAGMKTYQALPRIIAAAFGQLRNYFYHAMSLTAGAPVNSTGNCLLID
jgi:hypothetical protein